MNSSVVSSTSKPGIDSSLSSVPPVCPRPRPLILPNGTPHAATIGPTASVVLSPTPPVECLSTTRRPSALPRSIVSPLRTIASVSANVSAVESPWKNTAMQERRDLVVRHVAARVLEHELGDLVARQLVAVALPLDQLGDANHRGPSATKMTCRVVARKGSVNSGTSGARCARSIVAATNVAHRLGVREHEARFDVTLLDSFERPKKQLRCRCRG